MDSLRVTLLERVLNAHRDWVEEAPTTRRAAVFDIMDDKRAQAIEDYGKDVRPAMLRGGSVC